MYLDPSASRPGGAIGLAGASVAPALPLELVLDRVSDAVLVLDRELRVTHANAPVARLVGRAAGELAGLALDEVVPDDVGAEIAALCERSLLGEDAGPVELHAAAWRRWCAVRTHGGPEGVVVVLADVTARRRTEAALRESEAHFRSVAEQPLVGLFVARGGRLEYVNPHLASIFRRAPEEIVEADDLVELLVEQDRPLLRALLHDPREGDDRAAHHHVRGVRRGGDVVELEVHATRTATDGEPAVVGILLDITDRRRTEAALRDREEQLRHAQKLEAVGRLAGGIAHDFNNLLMVVQGTVDLILLDAEEPFPRQAELEEILRATDRAASLTRQLLAFSRKQVLRPKVVHLNALVDDLQKMIGRVIGEDVELVTELDAALGNVRVDPGQLEQVVLNLAVNARDAMPGGGRLTLRTANVEISVDEATRFPYRVVPGPYVRLSVHDTGCGMPESVRARVFEPFFTTKEPGQGTGLGLSMAYGIVKQSGGYIWAHSKPNRGTTIEIYLPRVEAPLAGSDRPVPRPSLPTGSGTVLLVEDEGPVRFVTRRILERAGYTVLEAASGREALAVFDAAASPADLLVTDVVMPEMGGRELAAHLQARHPDLRVVFMSGYADTRGAREGLSRAESAFVQKPFRPETLLQLVRSVLAR